MKNVLIMICCACLLGACDKAEVSSIYSGPDGIHFYYDQAGPFDADPYPILVKQDLYHLLKKSILFGIRLI